MYFSNLLLENSKFIFFILNNFWIILTETITKFWAYIDL